MKRLLVLIAAATLPACYLGPYDPYYSAYASYDPYYSAYDATYVYGTYDLSGTYYDAESPVELDAAAAAIAARAGQSFTKSECVRASASGPSVLLELDDCEHSFGGRNIYGRIGVVLSQEGGQLRFAVTSSNLRIDGEPFVVDFTGAATSSGTQRVVTVESRSRATERVDSRTSTGTITWAQGNPCVTIDAQSTSARRDVSVNSTLTGFQQCAGQCPTAGEVTVQGGEGVFVGSFDGSDNLRVFAPNGGERSFGLPCR